MDEFNFDEKELSTPINTLRKKKTELDDEKSYNILRNRLYTELNTPIIEKTSQYVPLKKNKKIKLKKQQYNYQNLFIFSLLFFLVNIYEFNVYLLQKKLNYYTIILIKLVLFLILNYIFKKFNTEKN